MIKKIMCSSLFMVIVLLVSGCGNITVSKAKDGFYFHGRCINSKFVYKKDKNGATAECVKPGKVKVPDTIEFKADQINLGS